MGKNKRHYHRLSGFALLIIAAIAVIFSRIMMPIGGSMADDNPSKAPSTAIFLNGPTFNTTLDSIISLTDIERIVRVNGLCTPPRNAVIVSDATSDAPIYAWEETRGVIYYCSDAITLYLQRDSSSMFQGLKTVISIDTNGWDTSMVENMDSMFDSCGNLSGLDVSSWNTSNVMNMGWMFNGCSNLPQIDVGHRDTSAVEDMSHMFGSCSRLTSLDVSNFVTNRVTDMSYMFDGCSNLVGLNVSHFDTRNVVNMAGMFAGCSNLSGLDISNFVTSSVTDMHDMFNGCSNLRGLDVSHLNTSSVSNMQYMFNGCSSLTGLDVTNFITTNVTNMNSMFAGCSNLVYLDVKYFDTRYVTDMRSMFKGCSSLTGLYVNDWYTDRVTNMQYMFANCNHLIELDLSHRHTSSVTDMSYMFQNCNRLENLYMDSFDTTSVTNMSYMFQNCSNLAKINVGSFDTKNVTNMSYMFQNCSNLMDVDVGRFDTSKVNYMHYMFAGCSGLTQLDVRNFVTSGVINMSYMFQNCRNLVDLNVDRFDTKNVTNMSYMFQNCSSLTNMDLENWNTSKVTNMSYMFNNCSSLIDVNTKYFITSGVTNMSYMFAGCSNLAGLSVENWNTSKVTNMSYMFSGCSRVTMIDLKNFVTNRVTNMRSMFQNCSNLNTIYASTGFIVSNVSNSNSTNMFLNSSQIVGGHGTKYDSSYTNKTRAVLDSEIVSGYLTYDIAVSFRTTSGVELARQVINVGSRAVAPIITGYRVLGYYKNTGLTNTFNFNQNLNKYTDVYLDWICDTGYVLKSGECVVPITATFLPGQTFNTRIKSLAAGTTITDNNVIDRLIQQVVRTGNIPVGMTTGLLSTNNSQVPVIGWFDNGILYYYTDADIIYLNPLSNTMFYRVSSGTYIDTSGWDTSNVTNMSYMFNTCNSLTNLDVSEWDTSSVTDMTTMFGFCGSLTGLDVSSWDTSNVTDMKLLFEGCSSLTSLDVSEWNTSNVTSMNSMFSKCSSLTGLDVSEWNTSSVTNMNSMFSKCSSLTGLDVSSWDTSNVTNMARMFDGCSGLIELDVSGWNTSSVTSMATMFQDCRSLTGLDVSEWNTSSVTNMAGMFSWCSGLIELDVSEWNTSSVTNMSYLFDTCMSLTELNVSNRDTSSVTNMGAMFQGCRSLTGLDVSEWDTSKVTNMGWMFNECDNLSQIDMDHWNTSMVEDMSFMFDGCNNLIELDVSRWDTSNVTDMNSMFKTCSRLKTIYASTGFITSGVTNSDTMFMFDQKLVGGHGTKYNGSITDQTRAVLDSETQSGYLTYDIAVSYRDGSGTERARQVINVGSSTVAPTVHKTGYVVSGWYVDTGYTTPFDFSQPLRTYTEVYIQYREATATFLPGNFVNGIMKRLAKGYSVSQGYREYTGDIQVDTGDDEELSGNTVSIPTAGSIDTGVLQIVRTGSIPVGVATGLISATNSDVPIIAWFDNGIIYYYTEASTIYLDDNARFMFYRFKNVTTIDTSGRDTSNVRTMNYMFGSCITLTRLDTSSRDTSSVTTMERMFSNCYRLTGIDVSNRDTSSVRDMNHMFKACYDLVSLNVSGWDTSSVTDMHDMFRNCQSLTGLDVSNWDTSNVTDIWAMFSNCYNLRELDVSNWDTSKVTNMSSIFNSCRSLTGIDISSWDTSHVTNMRYMFEDCRNLESLNIRNLDTHNVTNMSYMFQNCDKLTEIDLSDWDTSNVTNMENMFQSCNILDTIYASTGFTISNVISGNDMFYGSTKLIGGHGTKYSSSYRDKTRAVLDSSTQSGYLTYDIAVSYRDGSNQELTRQIINVGSSPVAPSVNKTGYVLSGWYTTTGYTTPFNFNQSIRKYTQVYAKFVDIDAPIVTLSVTTGEKQTGQTATLRCTDGAGVTKYYRGTTEPTQLSAININSTASLTGAGLAKAITGVGTYWLACRDAAGNWDKTSVTINSYTVQNMVDKLNGTQGVYNTTNYDASGTRLPTTNTVYLIPNGTQIRLSNNGLYGDPISGYDTYAGFTTTNNAGNTLSGTSNTNIDGNKNYYRWFNKNYYTLELLAATGIRMVNLPTGYTRVEYVQSQGSGYFDTEYVLSNHSSIEVEATIMGTINETAQQLFGNKVDTGRAVIIPASSVSLARFGDQYINQISLVPEPGRYTYKINSGGIWVNNIFKTGWSSEVGEFETEGSFYVFASHAENGPSLYTRSGTKIYLVKVEEDGILQFYGIPCRSGNVYGIYDIIGNKFHPSAGTTPLTGGADISKVGPGSYKYGDTVRIAPILKTIGYTFIEWIVNSGSTPEDISFPDTTVTITGNTTLTAVAEDITPPKSIFTGSTPADNEYRSGNHFTGEIQITEANLKTLSCTITGNGSTNTYSLYDDSLILMYNFDNVYSLGESNTLVKDLSSYERDGIVYGATWTGNGKWGGAFNFNGTTGNYIDFPDYGPLTQNGTISMWVKGNNKRLAIVMGSYNGLAVGFNSAGNIIGKTNSSKAIGTMQGYSTTGWNHIVVSIKAGTISYYVNGIKLTNGGSDSWSRTNNGIGRIGRRNNNTNPYPFSGQIDEIRVYNRALSTGEIQALYNSNLSKINAKKWLYTINYTGLSDGLYTYECDVVDVTGHTTGINRTINIDTIIPTMTLSVTTGEAQTSQTGTLKCSDGEGVTAYYRGKTEPGLGNITGTTTADLTALAGNAGLSKPITSTGTYWLACRDEAGNWSKTSVTINSYTVQNMIDKLNGTQGVYNTTNYSTSGTRLPSANTVYLILSGTEVHFNSGGLYGDPISGYDVYAGYTTTNNAGNTLSGTSNTNINGNKDYYRWFNRNSYTLELLAATGIRMVNLPTGYTRVEYVQSQTPRGTNVGGYIDTEYVLSNHSSIEIKAEANNNMLVQSNVATQLFGNNTYINRAISFPISNKSVFRFGTNDWTTTTGVSMIIPGNAYIYKDNSGGVYTLSLTGTVLKQHLWAPSGEFETEGSFYLFAGNHGGPEYYAYSGTKIYWVKVEEDGILQFYGIPCRSGSLYGIYDIIGNKFHPSTGAIPLAGGADIPKIGPGTYKYGDTVRIAPILKTIGYTFIEWIVNTGNAPEDISFPDTIVTITGNTILTAVAEDITPPKSIFTGTTPADNMCLNNYFTGETLITEVNLKTLSCNISGNESINTYSLYDDSLVLMYNFDNVYSIGETDTVVKDLSMHENDGIIGANVIATGGKWGGSYFFNAGHISVSDSSLTVTNNFTVSARIKTDTVHDNRNGHFLSRWYPDDNKRVWSMAVDSDGYLTFLVSKTGGVVNNHIVGPNIVDGQWHHAVMIHNGNDVLMYTDGIYIGKIANIGSLNDIPRILTIGNYAGGISFYGYIDEVRMYNRALNTGEIEQLYLSNLSRINVKKWLYSVNYTGLADGLYTYGCNIVDVAWHNTGLTRTMIIDKTPPTVTVNNGIGNESTRITGSVTASDTNAYCGGLTYYWTGDIGSGNTTTSFGWMENEPIIKTGYVNVTDGAGNTTIGAVRFTWKNMGPVNVNITRSPTSTGECGQITFTATGTDTGATLNYQWYTGANCTSPINGATGKTYQKTLNYSGTYSVYVKVSDSQGSGTCSTVNTATWTNIPLTANDFTGSTNVGNSAKTVSWKTLSNAIAGSCETISASIHTDGSKGHCSISGTNITYTPNTGQMGEDICTLAVTDGDGTVKIDVKRKNIDTGIPVCERGKPMPYCISGGMAGTISLTCTDNVGISQTRVRVNNVIYDAHLLTLGDSNSVAGTSTRKTYTFTYTGLTGASGSTGFILKTNAVLDTSNNGNEVTGPSIVIGVDNLAPDIPIMVTMPEYTQGLSSMVRCTEVRDNGCADKIQYQFCIKTEATIRTGADINNEWNNLGRSGAEGVERTGTAPSAKASIKIIELGNVEGEIQSWYEKGIIYIFTKSSVLKLPADSRDMFANMKQLKSINLGDIDTSDVTNMAGMFSNCSNLSTLNLSQFDMSNVGNVSNMFYGDDKLTTIYVSKDFALGKGIKSENMFSGCLSLVGGLGTIYNPKYVNATYAHIDGGIKNPGYLTENSTDNGIKAPVSDIFGCVEMSDWLDETRTIFSHLTDGQLYGYFVRTKDGLGNMSEWSHATTSTQDDTAPIITFNKQSGTPAAKIHNVVVTVTDNVAGLFANQKIKYRWQTGSQCSSTASLYTTGILSPATTGTHIATGTVTTAGLSDGSYYLCIIAGSVTDQVGNLNLTTQTTGVFIVDNTKPTCSISQNPTSGTWTSGNVTLTATVTETNPDKYSWTGWSNMVSTLTTFIITGNGTRNFYIKDTAGNTGTCDITVNNIDKIAPICTWGSPSVTTLRAGDTGSIVLTCIDTGAGINTAGISGSAITMVTNGLVTLGNANVTNVTNGKKYTFTYTANDNVSGNVVFTLPTNTVKDVAQNSAPSTGSATVTVDSVLPSAYVEYTYFVSGTLATLTGYNKSGITITNNGGSNTIRFPYTGSNFRGVFEYQDGVGNTGSTDVWGWNNEWYITSGFWTNNPTTGEIINAVYGDETANADRTAYTKLWTGVNCATGSMKIVYVNPGYNTIPNTLDANTIYLLNGGVYTKNAAITMTNCSALVGKTDDIYMYSTVALTNQIVVSTKYNTIIDNVKLDGTRLNQYSTGTQHGFNSYGIYVTSKSNNTTINRVESHDSLYGLYWLNSSNLVLENSQFYNNELYGVYLYPQGTKGAFVNNIQAYGNLSIGLYLMSTTSSPGLDSNISINNTQVYNNAYVGIYNRRNKNVVYNNIEIYNNNSYGLYIYESSGTIINNAKIYNNASYAVYLESNGTGTKFYGTMQRFGNGYTALTNRWSNLKTGNSTDYTSLGLSDGTLINQGSMSCSQATINNHWPVNLTSTCNGRSASIPNRRDRYPSQYLYGTDQNKQSQPLAYLNGVLTAFDSEGYNYDMTKYLGEVNPVGLVGTVAMTNDMRYTENQTVPLTLRTNKSGVTYIITGDIVGGPVNGTMSDYINTKDITLTSSYGYKHVYITYSDGVNTATDHIIIDYINITNPVIAKYFASGSDYVKYWEQNDVCDPAQMTVQTINPGTNTLRADLQPNTIYLLNQGTYVLSAYRYFAGNCIVLAGSGDVILTRSSYSGTGVAAADSMVYMTNRRNNIIDNIKVDGTSNGNGGSHTGLGNGIFTDSYSRYNIINNVQVYNIRSVGIRLAGSKTTLINNSQLFNNNYGIYLSSSSANNTVNNVQAFNNKEAGLYIYGSSSAFYNSVTNSQFYNNGKYGIYARAYPYSKISDVKSYNNGVAGLYLESPYGRYVYLNNVWLFNNENAVTQSGTNITPNYYNGEFRIFANGNNSFTAGFTTGSANSTLGWTAGKKVFTGEIGCDIVANPRNSEGVFLQTGSTCDTRGYITGWTNTHITGIMYGSNQIKQRQPIMRNIAGTEKLYGTQTFDYDVTKPIAYAYPIENMAPTVTLGNNGPKVESNTITWTATGSDDHDELSWLQYSFHSGSCDGPLLQSKSSTKTYSTGFNEPGNLILYVVVYDTMGLTGCTSSTGIWTNTGPTNVTISRNPTTTGECRPITFAASATDTGTIITYQWYTGANCTNAIAGARSGTYTYTLNKSGTYSVYVKVSDSQGSGTCSAVSTAPWTNIAPTLSTSTLTYSTRVSGTKLIYSDLFTSMGVIDGSCGAGTIKTGSITCTYTNGNGSATWSGSAGHGIQVTPPTNSEGTGTCTVTFVDDEGSTVQGTVKYRYDTAKPICSRGNPTETCISGGVAGTISLTCTDGVGISQTLVSGTNVQFDTSLLTLGNSSTVAGTSTSKTYTFTYTGKSSVNGSTGFTLKANAVKDTSNNGNVATGPSAGVQIDNEGPIYTLDDVIVKECNTGTFIVSGLTQVGCASVHEIPYSWNGGNYKNSISFGIYSGAVGSQIISVRVRDNLGNYTEKTGKITWTDAVLNINPTYNLGLITGSKTINNITGINIFNVTGYGSCETITINQGTCTKATMSLNGNNLTITPNPNTSGSGSCTIGFTDGDTNKTGTVSFVVQTLQPSVSFTGDVVNQINPNTSCINRNRFLTKMTISNTPELGDFTYTINETTNGNSTMKSYHAYDSGLVLMYNFDKVTSIGENNTIVKDLSKYGRDGIVHGATWLADGVHGGAFNFSGTTSSYIEFPSYGPLNQNGAISIWVKGSLSSSYKILIGNATGLVIALRNTSIIGRIGSSSNQKPSGVLANYNTNGWNHIVVSNNNGTLSYYVNGVKLTNSSTTDYYTRNYGSGTIGKRLYSGNSSYDYPFNGQIDEVRVYNRALSQDEIQFLYKSNLSKINTGEWLFQTLNTCLTQTGNYTYSGIVTSTYDYSQNIGRQISTCIPGVSFTGGIDMYLGMGTVSGKQQVFSGQYPINIQVEDWIGRNGWIGSVRISSNFSGENTNLSINSSNFTMKNNVLEDLGHYMNGIIPEYTTGLVQLSASLTDYANINTYQGNNQGTPYFVPNYPAGDFMCNGGIYGDKPYLQLNVPAWTPGDTYLANVYRTIEPM